MRTWKEIKDEYESRWVAIKAWEEDDFGDIIKGDVIYSNPKQSQFYAFLKEHYPTENLAVRYTGKVKGPFFIGEF